MDGMWTCAACMQPTPRAALALVLAGLLLAAAVIDARERRFPNALALALAVACALMALLGDGAAALARNALAACAACGALVALELAHRARRGGESGFGLGDFKFLFGLMLARPVFALAAFALGSLLLAVCGALTRRRALPLLPFAVAAVFGLALSGLAP